MKNTYNVESTYNDMRIDRWIRNNLGNIPQGLIINTRRKGNKCGAGIKTQNCTV